MLFLVFGEIFEAYAVFPKIHFHLADWPVAVFGDDDVGDMLAIGIRVFSFFAINKENHVGILFDRAAFTQIGQFGNLGGAGFDGAAELGQGQHRNIQFARQAF